MWILKCIVELWIPQTSKISSEISDAAGASTCHQDKDSLPQFSSKVSVDMISLGDGPQKQPITWLSLASSLELNKFKLHLVYSVALEKIKKLEVFGHAADFKSESKFEPFLRLSQRLLSVLWCSSGHTSLRLFQKAVNGFECKINGQALEAALWQSHGWSDWQAQHMLYPSLYSSCGPAHSKRLTL